MHTVRTFQSPVPAAGSCMSCFSALAQAYLALLPAFGWVSGSACSFAPWVSRGLVFFAAPFSYLLMYVFVCGSIHFYTQRREQISIQKKPMTDLETRRAIVFSIKSISSISAVSAFAYYVIQGWTNIHWGRPRLQEIPYLLIAYILVDISAYLVHRMLHRPWWYRHVHKAWKKQIRPWGSHDRFYPGAFLDCLDLQRIATHHGK